MEKKVEYLELIYDLIFVYLIGRNNALLHYLQDGFVPLNVFLTYVLSSLAVIQIWSFSTFYVNLYGRNGLRDHVFLFVNMYLMYHMADGISNLWQASFYEFNVAWCLILANLGLQQVLELRNHIGAPWVGAQLKRKAAILFGEAALVCTHMLVYSLTGVSVAYVPVLFGIVLTALSGRVNAMVPVDFMHLSERAMLYVVFTFGEMIISITGYFSGVFTWTSVYYSAMAFLIVVGLFLCYEELYNRIIDREQATNGTVYMMLHVFLIFALNNISVALQFMRESEVRLVPKTLFISGSFVLYFAFLFLLCLFAKRRCSFGGRLWALLALGGVAFILGMLLLRDSMALNIAFSALCVFGVFAILYRRGRNVS